MPPELAPSNDAPRVTPLHLLRQRRNDLQARRGLSFCVPLGEAPPILILDPPLPAGLTQGVIWIQYRVENVRILPVFGAGALNVSPRIGHLHIRVDDLPWLWADASDLNTVDLAGMPPGPHKVRIDLVNPNHQVFPECETCSQTVTFTVPESEARPH
jgi:hypothetical protein